MAKSATKNTVFCITWNPSWSSASKILFIRPATRELFFRHWKWPFLKFGLRSLNRKFTLIPGKVRLLSLGFLNIVNILFYENMVFILTFYTVVSVSNARFSHFDGLPDFLTTKYSWSRYSWIAGLNARNAPSEEILWRSMKKSRPGHLDSCFKVNTESSR